jgi:hypothetical protein
LASANQDEILRFALDKPWATQKCDIGKVISFYLIKESKMKAKFIVTIFVLTFIAALAWQTDTAKCQVVTKGLVSYWSLDANSITGKTLNDVWGKNHGAIKGNPKVAQGQIHQGMEFDGKTDHIVIANDDSLNIVAEITLSAWVFWNGETGIIVSKRDPVSYQFSAIQTGNPNSIQLCCPTCIYSDAVLAANKWMYVTAVRAGNKVYFYKDGKAAGVFDQPNAWVTNNSDLIIGGWPGDGYKFGGILDEISIYNRALNASEIQQNFASRGLAVVNFASKLTGTWAEIKFPR